MSEYKNLIESLHSIQSKYSSPESAQNLANSLDALSSDIYTDKTRFIFELIQNADDANSSESGSLNIRVTFDDNELTFSHNGKKFNDVDIESICSVGDGNKSSDSTKTGFKGIGFKAVFAHSSKVSIITGRNFFQFDKLFWENFWDNEWGISEDWKQGRVIKGKSKVIKMPWQIIPIWKDDLNNPYYNEDYSVSTILELNNLEDFESEIVELFTSSPQIILFLRNQNIRLEVLGIKNLVVEKVTKADCVELYKNDELHSKWLIKSYTLDIPTEIQESSEQDYRIPKKLKINSTTAFTFAALVEDYEILEIEKNERLIFSYLPTSVNLGFPFLLNADVITDASRQHIHEDLLLNQWLFGQISYNLFNWISELSLTDYQSGILRLVSKGLNNFGTLNEAYNEGYYKAINEIKFLPNTNNQLIFVKESLLDKIQLRNIIESNGIVYYLNSNNDDRFTVDSFLIVEKPISVLRNLGVKVIELTDLIGYLDSNKFAQITDPKENYSIIEKIYSHINKNLDEKEKEIWNKELAEAAFIIGSDGNYVTPSEAYLPSNDFSIDGVGRIELIHEYIYEKIKSNSKIRNWFDNLGLRKPSHISFIEKAIINNKLSVDTDNAIEVGRLVFDAYLRGKITKTHLSSLRKLKVLTKKGTLASAENVVLSNIYQPEINFEEHYGSDELVSEDYLREKDLASDWKSFFIRIGVQHKIELVEFIINVRNYKERTDFRYFEKLIEEMDGSSNYANPNYTYSVYKFKVHHYSMFDKLSTPEIAKIFWTEVLKSEHDNATTDLVIGASGWWDKNHTIGMYKLTSFQNYFDWTLNSLEIFPTVTGKLLISKDVFLNRQEIKEVGGKYLDILDLDMTVPDTWLEKIQFKSILKLDDYLDILHVIQEKWNDSDNEKVDVQRISKIYKIVSSNYLHESEKIAEWGTKNMILCSNETEFDYPCNLSITNIKGIESSGMAYGNVLDSNELELIRILGVNVVDEIVLNVSDSTISQNDIKTKITQMLPLIALVFLLEEQSNTTWEEIYNGLESNLTQAEFYKTSEIRLSHSTFTEEILKSTYLDGDRFYYVGEWYRLRILDGIVESLSDYLSIESAKWHLPVLLLDDFNEGVKYVKEKFGNECTTIIPNQYLVSPQENMIVPNLGNRAYNQSDSDLGHRGELFVYETFKRAYLEKYSPSKVVETKDGFQIEGFVNVIWRNKNNRSTTDHDFKIEENGSIIFVDSKATPYSIHDEKVAFFLSSREFILMESVNRYFIARVFNVTSAPIVKFIKLNTVDVLS